MKLKLEKNVVYLALIACAVALVFLLYNLSNTVDTIARTLLEDKADKTKTQLEQFFSPVIDNVIIAHKRGENSIFDSIQLEEFDLHFIPFINQVDQVSSLLYANSKGNEYMLLKQDSTWVNRVTKNGSESEKSKQYEWEYKNNNLFLVKEWEKEELYDPRLRPWFQGAIESYPNENWTEPYTFFTTKEPGITVSKKWSDSNQIDYVIAFDLLLTDISKFTMNTNVSENGNAFVFMHDNRVLGLPKSDRYQNIDSLKADILKPLEKLRDPLIDNLIKNWKKQTSQSKAFSFAYSSDNYWAHITPFQLGNNILYIAVLAPDKDFMAEVKQTKWMIIFGFVLIFIFALILIRTNKRKEKDNELLKKQKKLIRHQKEEVEEKNKEILDSINYAKRIQVAILPPENLVKEYLPNSFILYKPKDIVAGDFYWLEKVSNVTARVPIAIGTKQSHTNDKIASDSSNHRNDGSIEQSRNVIIFAAADCTGHGVPGAMISVVCHNALNRAVREFGLIEPGKILDKTRELVIEQFEKSEEEVKDGMDIALCVLNTSTDELYYSGANNPLWIIRNDKKEIEEIKGDKQPIGKYVENKNFVTHKISLNKGDFIYVFTDGFADQFGGPKGKKFKYKSFKELLISYSNLPLDSQHKKIDQRFEDWKGEVEQLDDVCVIGVKI